MVAMRFKQVQRFILAKKYFGVRGTSSLPSLYGRVLKLCGNCKSNVMIRGKYREKILSESSEEAANRPSSICKYSGVATRLYGQISLLSSIFFVSQVSRESSKQNNIRIYP